MAPRTFASLCPTLHARTLPACPARTGGGGPAAGELPQSTLHNPLCSTHGCYVCSHPVLLAEAVAAQLAGEFPEFDAGLITELLAQEDGDDGELMVLQCPVFLMLLWLCMPVIAVAHTPSSAAAHLPAIFLLAYASQPDVPLHLPSCCSPFHRLPAAAVKYCLRKMRAQAAAEEKKKQRQAKLDGGAGSGKAAGSAGAEEAEVAAQPEAKAAAGKAAKGKRGRSRSASAEVEAEGAAAKKVKA